VKECVMFATTPKPGAMIAQIQTTHVGDKAPGNDLESLKRLRRDMLPVEAAAEEQVAAAIADFQLAQQFNPIDMSFLKMRRGPWPTFAVYNIFGRGSYENPQGVCRFRVEFRDRGSSSHTTSPPSVLDEYFKDVVKRLELRAKRLRRRTGWTPFVQVRATTQIYRRFSGVIPHEVRQKIRTHKDKFDSVVLIEEADKWTYHEDIEKRRIPPPPRVIDPLVIGLSGNRGYLIDAFNIQPIEEAVAREFTKGQNPINMC